MKIRWLLRWMQAGVVLALLACLAILFTTWTAARAAGPDDADGPLAARLVAGYALAVLLALVALARWPARPWVWVMAGAAAAPPIGLFAVARWAQAGLPG